MKYAKPNKAWQLLGESQDRWCKGAYYRNVDGIFGFNALSTAVCWCMVGAVANMYRINMQEAKRLLIDHGIENPLAFNDNGTYKQVVDKLKELDL